MFTCVCPYTCSSLFKRMLITELMFSEEWANLAIQMFLLHHKRKYYIFLSPHTTELWRGNWVCPMCVCACVCVYVCIIHFITLAPTFMYQFSFYFTQLSIMTISWTSFENEHPRLFLEKHCHHSGIIICGQF